MCDFDKIPGFFLFLKFHFNVVMRVIFSLFTCYDITFIVVTDMHNFSFNIIKLQFDILTKKRTSLCVSINLLSFSFTRLRT